MTEKSHALYENLLARAEAGAAGRPPRPSAAVVPWRRGSGGELEVYWVRRSPALPFMGGWHAFPGGGLSRRDAELAVEGTAECSPEQVSDAEPELDEDRRRRLGPDLAPGLLVAAIRELFEETGLLLAPGVEDADSETLTGLRQRLLAGDIDFPELAAEQGWRPSADQLVFAGRWLTPPFAPRRFDNRFFLLEWPSERRLQPTILPGELVHGEWLPPARALAGWRDGEVITAPPILHILKVLAEDGPERGRSRLRQPDEVNFGSFRRIEFRPGVTMLPLLTPTLPPATHTNAFLLGHQEVVLVDPATPLVGEQERLERAVDAAQERGLRVRAIWLTHHHRDHIGAVERMRRKLGVGVFAHPLSIEPLRRQGIRVDGELQHGERVELAGDPPFSLRVLHTPGHTRGHLCFLDETHGSLIAGDLVSALSTIVIDPPEGDMDAYLRSLEQMIELAPRTLFPAHGPPILQAVEKLEAYHAHRLDREGMVRQALADGVDEPAAIVERVYAEVPREMYPVAERQVLAHLERLRKL